MSLVVTYFAWRAYVQLNRKRLIENTPTSRIRSASQGYVEFHGVAGLIDGDPICASLSGQRCAWYRYSIERKERTTNHRGQTATRWQTISHGISEHLFEIRDSTGACVIDPDGALITPSVRNRWYGPTAQPTRIAESDKWSNWFDFASFGRAYRYTEERITVGAPLYVLGQFRTRAGASAPSDSADITGLLGEWKRDQTDLRRRFDANGDGEIDSAEWEIARTTARAEVAQRNTKSRPLTADTMGATGNSDRPYILSALNEEKLLTRVNRYAAILGTISFAGALVLGWSLLIRANA